MRGDPVWDRSGKYLFFTASTDSGSSLQPDIQAMARTPTVEHLPDRARQGRSLAAVAAERRRKGADASKSDGGEARGWRRTEAKEARRAGSRAAAPAVTIDFDNILQRMLALPMPPRAYLTLQAGKAGTLLALEAPLSAPGHAGRPA